MNLLWMEERRTINSVLSSSFIFKVHCILVNLLQDPDIVVRLSAVIALRMCKCFSSNATLFHDLYTFFFLLFHSAAFDSNDFVAEKFMSFFDSTVKALFQLALELSESTIEIPPLLIFQIMVKRLVNTGM